MMIGKPYSSVKLLTSSNLSTAPSVPGTTGTPALIASFRAETLSPRDSMTSGVGPTNYYDCQRAAKQNVLQPRDVPLGLLSQPSWQILHSRKENRSLYFKSTSGVPKNVSLSYQDVSSVLHAALQS